jgi:hypothetical protein
MVTLALRWTTDPSLMALRLQDYQRELEATLLEVAEYFAEQVEEIARQIAPWHDVTGAARAGLKGTAQRVGSDLVISLVHTVSYGIYLELGTVNMQPYPAIVPALEQIYGPLMDAMDRVVG